MRQASSPPFYTVPSVSVSDGFRRCDLLFDGCHSNNRAFPRSEWGDDRKSKTEQEQRVWGPLLRGSATCCVSMPKGRGRGWSENYLLCHQRPYPSKTKRSSVEPTKSNYSYSIFNNQRQPTLPRELSPRLMTSRPGFSRL